MTRKIHLILLSLLLMSCSFEHSERLNDDEVQAGPLHDELPVPQLPLPQMTDYTDPILGFEALVPVDWRRVVPQEGFEPGSFSITFESPPSHDQDQFSDYLLIELLPGEGEPSFQQTPNDRTAMRVDGLDVFRERYVLNQYPVQDTRMDLVAWQINLARRGYTVGIYAVGESREDSRLERILIEFAHSFKVKRAPFLVS